MAVTVTLREQILTAAKTRLLGISQANEYRTTPRRISGSRADFDTNELPLLILLEDLEQDITDYLEATLSGTVDEYMGLEVTAVAIGSDSWSATGILNDLDADVVKAFGTQLGLNDFVLDVRRMSGGGRDGSEWSDQAQGWRAWRSMKFTIWYYHAEGAE